MKIEAGRLTMLSRTIKVILQLFFDLLSFLASIIVLLFFNRGNLLWSDLWPILSLVPLVFLALILAHTLVGTFKLPIRYFQKVALLRLALVSALTTLSIRFLLISNNIPFSTDEVSTLLITFYLFIVGWRFLSWAMFFWQPQRSSRQNVALFGVDHNSRQLLSMVRKSNDYQATCFIENSENLHGVSVDGLKVVSIDEFLADSDRYGSTVVLIDPDNLSSPKIPKIMPKLYESSVQLKTIPSLSELIGSNKALTDLRNLRIEELIGRKPHDPFDHLIKRDINGKSVLITGAGGTIGSEICRQAIRAGAARLIALDNNELGLYEVTRELKKLAGLSRKSVEVRPVLCSILNRKTLNKIFSEEKVDTVYHAAAYKHVPLAEEYIFEFIRNNVIGTLNVSSIAIKAGVTKFILISSDKAVRPTNIMGATKRVTELICMAHNKKYKKTKSIFVRFGNVIGSSGSVVPLFQEQIQQGGPVTVTDKKITRYFMTTEEAASLVIQAGAMTGDDDYYVLDMGQPVRILDVAKNLIKINGLRTNFTTKLSPKKTDQKRKDVIDIVITGLRPGEKLFEELFIEETAQKSEHPKIYRGTEKQISASELDNIMKDLTTASKTFDKKLALRALTNPHVGYKPTRERKMNTSTDTN